MKINLQRMREVVEGAVRANRHALIGATLLLAAWLLGAVSPAGLAFGGLLLGLGFVNVLTAATAVGTLFNTYTAAKSVINATNLVQFPPNYIFVGKKLRVTVRGGVSNIVTTPGTITFQIMMGAIVAWTSGAIQLNATAHTLLPFTLVVDLRCDSIGAGVAAKFLGMGQLSGIMFTVTAAQIDGVNTETVLQVPRTAPAVGTGFDSTIADILDFWVGF